MSTDYLHVYVDRHGELFSRLQGNPVAFTDWQAAAESPDNQLDRLALSAALSVRRTLTEFMYRNNLSWVDQE
jgi:hypothetical protein